MAKIKRPGKILGWTGQIIQQIKDVLNHHSQAKIIFTEQDTVRWLGLEIRNFQLRPSEEKVKAIVNFQRPKNRKGVQSFIGLCSFFRQFIPMFAEIAKGLHNTTKINPFKWNEAAEKSLNAL